MQHILTVSLSGEDFNSPWFSHLCGLQLHCTTYANYRRSHRVTSDFTHVASFRHKSDSKTPAVEIGKSRPNFELYHPCKITREMDEMSESMLDLWSNLRCTSDERRRAVCEVTGPV